MSLMVRKRNEWQISICKKIGNYQKYCQKYKSWFEKKDKFILLYVLYQNLIEVPNNNCWFDSSDTTNISNMMQRFLSIQPSNPIKDFLFIGNRMKALIKGIGTYHLVLDTRYHLDLFQALYVPSISKC